MPKIKINGVWENFPYPTSIGNFTGASDSVNGQSGMVPAPVIGDQTKFLSGDGTWKKPQLDGDEVALKKDVAKINSSGHIVFSNGAELWVE